MLAFFKKGLLFVLLGMGGLFAQDFVPGRIIFKVKQIPESIELLSGRLEQAIPEIEVLKLWQKFPVAPRKPLLKTGFTAQPANELHLIYEVEVDLGVAIRELVNELMQQSWVVYAQPHYLPRLAGVPNDPSLTRLLPYFTNMQLYEGWDIWKGDTTTMIGLLDTGTDPSHPDLIQNIAYNYSDPVNGIDDDNDGYIDNFIGWDLGENDNDVSCVKSGHGAHLSGVMAATVNNGIGVAGTAYHCRFLPVKIDEDTNGTLIAAYEGIKYAADRGCKIINCSWGGYVIGPFEREVIDYAVNEKQCLVIASAGNDDRDDLFYPAALDGVLAVTAVDESDRKVFNANFHENIDLSAPGQLYYSTWKSGFYETNTGTSVSAAVVSGIAGIVCSYYPKKTPQEIIGLLKSTADFIYNDNPEYIYHLGSGRVNLYRALSGLETPGFEITDFHVYPNPFISGSHEELYYYFFLQEEARIEVEIYNINGARQTLVNSSVFPDGVYRYKLPHELVAPGVYVLILRKGKEEFKRKIVVR